MAKTYIQLDAKGMEDVMKKLAYATGKTIPQLVRAYARVCAVELANRTQPFSVGKGVGKAALERQKGYLHNELLKVAKDKEALDAKATSIADAYLRGKLQEAIASGKHESIAQMLVMVGTIKHVGEFNPVSGPSHMKQIHRRSTRTGKTLSTRPIYHFAKKGIQGYVNLIAKRIGYTKSGWAKCARDIGGVKGDGGRGIPAFAKKMNTGNGRVVDNSSDKSNPHFIMTNTTPWVSRILDKGEESQASHNARVRMIKGMNIALREIAKSGSDPSAVTTQIIDSTSIS
jgi:hypothetical protein